MIRLRDLWYASGVDAVTAGMLVISAVLLLAALALWVMR